jgi:hypothetical protein
MTDNVINHLRLASANDLPLMTQEQLTNTVVMLMEQMLSMQEGMINMVQEQKQILEWVKSIKTNK